MAKSIKGLLGITRTIRSLGPLTNYGARKRFVQTSARCSHDYNKESLVAARPHILVGNADPLEGEKFGDALKSCRTRAHVFNLITTRGKKMSAAAAIDALNTLVKVESASPTEKISPKIYECPEFLTLCEILKKNIRSLDIGNLISALKGMVFFKVPTTSVIVQLILQMIRNDVNNLELNNISFLDFLLNNCENTPLVEALRIALPMIYENNLLMKLDREDIHSLKNALSYLSEKSNNTAILGPILHAINNYRGNIDPATAKTIFWSLCKIRCYVDELPQCLNLVQNILIENIESLNHPSVVSLLHMVAQKKMVRESYYYNEGFADACGTMAITKDWGFKDAISILSKLVAIGHTHIPLLDYIAGKCYEDSSLLALCSPNELAILISGFSAADYKPIFWDALQVSVTSDRLLEIRGSLSKVAVDLLSLDVYCEKILAKSFEEFNEMPICTTGYKSRILTLYQAVKTLYPRYAGPLPKKEISKLFRPAHKFQNFPLVGALESALGGRNYVLTNVRSKLGHNIDHLIVMGKGRYPIPINCRTESEDNVYPIVELESVEVPKNSQAILLLCLPSSAYSINTLRMKANWLLKIKTLESCSGYTVVPIRWSMWMSLSEFEKIPYLMRAIKLKCDEMSVSANS